MDENCAWLDQVEHEEQEYDAPWSLAVPPVHRGHPEHRRKISGLDLLSLQPVGNCTLRALPHL